MALCVSECFRRKRAVDVGAREEGVHRDGGRDVEGKRIDGPRRLHSCLERYRLRT